MIGRRVRHALQTAVSTLILSLQYMPVQGPWMGSMVFPLWVYFLHLMWIFPDFFGAQIDLLLFAERLMLGRIVAGIGFAIFLAAGVQFLRKKKNVITAGVYSVVRHPQYLGISIMTLGLTIMCIQFTGGHRYQAGLPWLFQTLGYILLAAFEEYHLSNEYGKEFEQYRRKVPFIFPVPRISKIPEPFVSAILASFIAFIVTVPV